MVTATVDDNNRIRLPDAKPGDVLAIQPNADGSITLLPITVAEPPPPNFRLVKENGFTVIQTDRAVSLDTIKELLAELP